MNRGLGLKRLGFKRVRVKGDLELGEAAVAVVHQVDPRQAIVLVHVERRHDVTLSRLFILLLPQRPIVVHLQCFHSF